MKRVFGQKLLLFPFIDKFVYKGVVTDWVHKAGLGPLAIWGQLTSGGWFDQKLSN